MSAIDDPKANRPVFLIDKDFAEAALRFASPSWEMAELTDKQRSFLCMAADMCRGWLGLPFLMHRRGLAIHRHQPLPLGSPA